MSLTGFDFNGVVDTGRMKPSINDVIITGNTDVKSTLDWLSINRIQCAVYFPSPTIKRGSTAAAVWKIMMITLLGVDKFYEDDTDQVELIQAACPGCEVVRVF